SRGRSTVCAYSRSGDSQQCEFNAEHGITGLQGALAETIAIPAVNCIPLPDGVACELGALIEPLGCVLHSSDRVEQSQGRFTFSGSEPIRNILICGAGPAGLLFLQYLRNVKNFEGLILTSDIRKKNLDLAR